MYAHVCLIFINILSTSSCHIIWYKSLDIQNVIITKQYKILGYMHIFSVLNLIIVENYVKKLDNVRSILIGFLNGKNIQRLQNN